MSFKNAQQLKAALLGLKLVDEPQLDDCITEAGGTWATPAAVLSALERRHLLTPYQVGKLAKGETDGLVLGEYKLLYRNASGSFARVYRACSLRDGRMIGLKVLRQRWASDQEAIDQFRREAALCKKLRHKNIVPIYDVGSEGDYHYFTMEFVEGGNLRDFIKIRKKLSPAEAARYGLDMAEGLEYALSQGMSHRDFKMTNVLISADGVAKLVDFGLAGTELPENGDSESVQRALEYATLEKGTHAPRDDPRSDLYFLGAVLYELLTGTPPYPPTRNREERKLFSRYANIRPIREIDREIPPCIADIVDRLMRVNPNERYQRPKDVATSLRAALAELGVERPADEEEPAEQSTGEKTTLPTVLCVESRAKQQDLLREYLSKHGFRVLVLTDLQRALSRLQQNPPDCIVLMGESLGDSKTITHGFWQAVNLGNRSRVVVVAVLGEKQTELRSQLEESPRARVLVLPATLRELRKEIHLAIQRRKKDGE